MQEERSMRRTVSSICAAAVVGGSLVALLNAQAPGSPAAPAQVTFAKDIQPVLEKSCWSCHSADLKLAELESQHARGDAAGRRTWRRARAGQRREKQAVRMAAGLDQRRCRCRAIR
jgi:hypothetical protein